MKKLQDIFDQEIKAGDTIMYFYKNYGVMRCVFGEVLNVHKHSVKYYHQGWEWRLRVRRIMERDWNHKWERVEERIVYLTNPMAIIWLEDLPEPVGDRK